MSPELVRRVKDPPQGAAYSFTLNEGPHPTLAGFLHQTCNVWGEKACLRAARTFAASGYNGMIKRSEETKRKQKARGE